MLDGKKEKKKVLQGSGGNFCSLFFNWCYFRNETYRSWDQIVYNRSAVEICFTVRCYTVCRWLCCIGWIYQAHFNAIGWQVLCSTGNCQWSDLLYMFKSLLMGNGSSFLWYKGQNIIYYCLCYYIFSIIMIWYHRCVVLWHWNPTNRFL